MKRQPQAGAAPSAAARERALLRGPGFWGFLLAHHPPGQLDRCYQTSLAGRPIWICARCLGLYPVLLVLLGAQLGMRPKESDWDWLLLFVLPLPALVDWSVGVLTARKGNNLRRTLTGALLGISLGRSLYLHLVHPGRLQVLIQFGLLAGWAAAVLVFWRWIRENGCSGDNREPPGP